MYFKGQWPCPIEFWHLNFLIISTRWINFWQLEFFGQVWSLLNIVWQKIQLYLFVGVKFSPMLKKVGNDILDFLDLVRMKNFKLVISNSYLSRETENPNWRGQVRPDYKLTFHSNCIMSKNRSQNIQDSAFLTIIALMGDVLA